MAKCRSLIQENAELGKQISQVLPAALSIISHPLSLNQGRVAQLEAEIALQKKLNQEIKTAQDGGPSPIHFLREKPCVITNFRATGKNTNLHFPSNLKAQKSHYTVLHSCTIPKYFSFSQS